MDDLGGVFTAAQARTAGVSTSEVRRRLRSGDWVRLRRGVYALASYVAAVERSPQRRHALEVAALLAALDFPAVAGAESAARIWGIELLRPGREPVLVAEADVATSGRRGGYLMRKAQLPPHHQIMRHGVPLTSVARTVFDLSRQRPFVDGVVAVDAALRQGLVSREVVDDLLRECGKWPGAVRARGVFDFADPNAESVLESVSRVTLHEQGLPPPRTQVTIYDERGMRYRVDFLWEEARVIGESDGIGKYEPRDGRTTREILQAEKRREEWLADAGYEVVRWGWDEARFDQHGLAHRVGAALARGLERRGRRAS